MKTSYIRFVLLVISCLGLVLPGYSQNEATTLTIIHTSSFYNHIQEYTPFRQPLQGGAPRLATAVKQIRTEHSNSLLLSSGGDVMGTPMFAQYGGVVTADVMSRIGYDAALTSSIDLGAGGTIDAFRAYNAVADYPLLVANLDLGALAEIEVFPYYIYEFDGVQVGVIGIASELGGAISNLGESISLLDTETVLEDNLAFFEGQGIDIVVVLSSLGIERDREIAQLYNGPDGIDVIIGNDSSTILGDAEDFPEIGLKPIGPYPLVFNAETAPTVVVYAGRFGSYLGELNLAFDENGVLTSWGGELHFMDESIMPDPEMQAYVDELVAGINLNNIVIGEAVEELTGDFREYSWQENPLANLYADAFLEAGEPFGAEIALINAGAVWGSLPQGELTVADLTRVQPFFNWLVVTDLTGVQLKAALEHGVSNYGGPNNESGPFPHVAGLTYTFDPSQDVGNRILEIQFNGEVVTDDAIFTVALNDFMANGGDGYIMLREGSNTFNTGLAITEILQQYIEANSPLQLPIGGRIITVE